jgi:hypothetical protein
VNMMAATKIGRIEPWSETDPARAPVMVPVCFCN